jgi:hypothetical protein
MARHAVDETIRRFACQYTLAVCLMCGSDGTPQEHAAHASTRSSARRRRTGTIVACWLMAPTTRRFHGARMPPKRHRRDVRDATTLIEYIDVARERGSRQCGESRARSEADSIGVPSSRLLSIAYMQHRVCARTQYSQHDSAAHGHGLRTCVQQRSSLSVCGWVRHHVPTPLHTLHSTAIDCTPLQKLNSPQTNAASAPVDSPAGAGGCAAHRQCAVQLQKTPCQAALVRACLPARL